GVQGQEDGRSPRQRAGHHAEPQGRAHRCGARTDHGRGIRSGLEGRLDRRSGRGEEGAAGWRAGTRRVPSARGGRRWRGRREGERVMELEVKTLDGGAAGSITVSDEIFGLEPRTDLIHRVVRWQLAKRQAGTHKTKTRSELSATGAKMYRQKGTGRARHSDRKAPQFRGGGKAFGPVVRSHEHD